MNGRNKENAKQWCREWYKKHPEKSSEYSRKHREKNKEKRYLQSRVCVEKNREYYKKYQHEYYIRNKNKLRLLNKIWSKNNPEKIKQIKQKWNKSHQAERNKHLSARRAKLILLGNFNSREWKKIKEYYNFICQICKKQEPEIKLTIDHIIPISRGGLHQKENIQSLCQSCNSRKNNKLMGELNEIIY